MIRIEVDDVSRPEVLALVEFHLRAMHEISPPESVFALDLSGLRHPDVTVWTIWEGGDLLGMGGLKELDPRQGEIKSMRTAPAVRWNNSSSPALAIMRTKSRCRSASIASSAASFPASASRTAAADASRCSTASGGYARG